MSVGGLVARQVGHKQYKKHRLGQIVGSYTSAVNVTMRLGLLLVLIAATQAQHILQNEYWNITIATVTKKIGL
jgi:hypothetical protein